VIVGAVMGAGMSLVWMQLGSVRDLRCPETVHSAMVPAMLRRFCFYSWYSQKKVYESIFGDEGQGGFRLYYINMSIAPGKDRRRSPLPYMSWSIMVPKPKKPPNLGSGKNAIAIDPDSPV